VTFARGVEMAKAVNLRRSSVGYSGGAWVARSVRLIAFVVSGTSFMGTMSSSSVVGFGRRLTRLKRVIGVRLQVKCNFLEGNGIFEIVYNNHRVNVCSLGAPMGLNPLEHRFDLTIYAMKPLILISPMAITMQSNSC
jgi:hypothetical protein